MALAVAPTTTPTLDQNFSVAPMTYTVADPGVTPSVSVVPSSGGLGNATGSPQVAGQAVSPTLIPNSTTTSGGSTTTTSTADAAAAAAAAANAAKIAALISSGTQSALAGGQGSTASAVGNISGLGDSLATTVGTGQNTIDEARKNIGLNQINSIRQLTDTIRQGLQGTGVNLGNTNALDSSAANAAARAYANYGNVQENTINNSASTANADQDVQQKNLDLTSENGRAAIKAARDSAIGTIQAQAAQSLQGLATTIAYMGGDASQLDIKGIQDQILQEAQDKLAMVDANINNLLGGIHPLSADQIATNAEAASNAGVVPSGPSQPFQLGDPTQTPATTLGGADTSLIPLTLKPRETA